MKPILGSVLKIVFLNLHYLLRVSAVPFLLVYVFKALAFPAAPFTTLTSICILGDVFTILFLCFTTSPRDLLEQYGAVFTILFFCFTTSPRDLLDLRSNPNPNPNLHSCRDVSSNLCFVFYSVALANQLNAVYTTAATIIVCRNFLISAILGVIAGAMYTVLTLMCSLDKCYPIVEDSWRWVDYLIMRCIDLVQTSKWVAAVTFFVAVLFDPTLFGSSLPTWIQAKSDVLSVIWRWVAIGVSVSLLPVLFLCVMAAHDALYLSCRSHHNKSSADTLSDSSVPLLDEKSCQA